MKDTAAWATEWCLEYHRIVNWYGHTTDARQIAVLDQRVVNMIQDKTTRFADMVETKYCVHHTDEHHTTITHMCRWMIIIRVWAHVRSHTFLR